MIREAVARGDHWPTTRPVLRLLEHRHYARPWRSRRTSGGPAAWLRGLFVISRLGTIVSEQDQLLANFPGFIEIAASDPTPKGSPLERLLATKLAEQRP